MRIIPSLAAAAIATMLAVPATAEGMKLYPYPSKENYCPSGLQPISMGGVICCGTPNTHVTYAQMMRHPVVHRVVYHEPKGSPSLVCEEGEKGCR